VTEEEALEYVVSALRDWITDAEIRVVRRGFLLEFDSGERVLFPTPIVLSEEGSDEDLVDEDEG
jgi:hypothetical protein